MCPSLCPPGPGSSAAARSFLLPGLPGTVGISVRKCLKFGLILEGAWPRPRGTALRSPDRPARGWQSLGAPALGPGIGLLLLQGKHTCLDTRGLGSEARVLRGAVS